MNEAAFVSQALRDRLQESGYIVVSRLQNLLHALKVAAGFPDFGYSLPGDDTLLSPRLANSYLHLEPLVELGLVRPDLLHLCPGIPFNHPSTPFFDNIYFKSPIEEPACTGASATLR